MCLYRMAAVHGMNWLLTKSNRLPQNWLQHRWNKQNVKRFSGACPRGAQRCFCWQYLRGMKTEYSKRLWKTTKDSSRRIGSYLKIIIVLQNISINYIWFPCLVKASSWLGLSSIKCLPSCISHSVEKILDHCKRGSFESRVHTKTELAAGSSSFNCPSSSSIWNALLVIWSLDTAQCKALGGWGWQESCLGGRLGQPGLKLEV